MLGHDSFGRSADWHYAFLGDIRKPRAISDAGVARDEKRKLQDGRFVFRRGADNRLDAAHTGRGAFFLLNLEALQVAGIGGMGAAADFLAV